MTEDPTGSVVVPIYQVSTYRQKEPGAGGHYVYSRTGNPTRTALEKNLAALEEADYCLAFASGMAATTTLLLGLLRKGDHVVAGEDLYGGTRRFFDRVMKNFGIDFSYVKGSKPDEFRSKMNDRTKLVWIETPSNPLMRVVDIGAAAQTAHDRGALLVVDNTFCSPYLQRPIGLGSDLVVHSTTKYLGGHSDLVGGAVVTSNKELYDNLRFAQNTAGAIPGPFDCWLVLRGVKTLAVRMEKHCSNAQRVAEFLEGHQKIDVVNYPGLRSHPQHEIAKKQMAGFGGMLSFRLKKGLDACKNLLRNVKVFTAAESLGGVESLIEHPATMTHASVPKEERERIGITDSLIRLSVGIEDEEDLVSDLSSALDRI